MSVVVAACGVVIVVVVPARPGFGDEVLGVAHHDDLSAHAQDLDGGGVEIESPPLGAGGFVSRGGESRQ